MREAFLHEKSRAGHDLEGFDLRFRKQGGRRDAPVADVRADIENAARLPLGQSLQHTQLAVDLDVEADVREHVEIQRRRCCKRPENQAVATFGDGRELSIETFLLEPLAGETPRRIRVEFLWRVRDERQFPDAQALKQQILRDAGVAQAYFRRLKKW